MNVWTSHKLASIWRVLTSSSLNAADWLQRRDSETCWSPRWGMVLHKVNVFRKLLLEVCHMPLRFTSQFSNSFKPCCGASLEDFAVARYLVYIWLLITGYLDYGLLACTSFGWKKWQCETYLNILCYCLLRLRNSSSIERPFVCVVWRIAWKVFVQPLFLYASVMLLSWYVNLIFCLNYRPCPNIFALPRDISRTVAVVL